MRSVNVTIRGTAMAFFVLLAACSSKKNGTNLSPGGYGGSNLYVTGGNGGATGHGGSTTGGHGGAAGSVNTVPPCASIAGINGDCGTSSTAAVLKTPNILVMIDKSGSMTDPLGGATIKKWDALNQALSSALTGVQAQVSFGMELFPGATVSDCSVPDGAAAIDIPIDVGTTTVPLILDKLTKTQPGGGTPTAAALERAYEYFTQGAGKSLTGERFVLLATDGGPNCGSGAVPCAANLCTANLDNAGNCTPTGNSCCTAAQAASLCLDDKAVVTQITNLFKAGIPTFVVGLPGTDQYSTYLDAFAVAGGKPANPTTPKYYRVDAAGGVAGLTSVFQSITTQLIHSCDIKLSENPPNPDQLNVAIDCKAVPAVIGTDGGTTGGWVLDQSTSPDTVKLQGATCDYIQNNGAKRIDVIFGCPTLR